MALTALTARVDAAEMTISSLEIGYADVSQDIGEIFPRLASVELLAANNAWRLDNVDAGLDLIPVLFANRIAAQESYFQGTLDQMSAELIAAQQAAADAGIAVQLAEQRYQDARDYIDQETLASRQAITSEVYTELANLGADLSGEIQTATQGLQTSIDGITADLQNSFYTRVDTDLAITAAELRLSSSIDTEVNDIYSNLSQIYYTRANVDGIVGAAITSLEGQIDTASQTLSGNIDEIRTLDLNALNGTALANLLNELQVDANGNSAIVSEQATAIADLQNGASAGYLVRAQAGGAVSLLDLVAANDGISPPTSVARISADNILLDGTVSTEKLVVGIGRNQLENSNWKAGTAGWAFYQSGSGGGGTAATTFTIRPRGQSWAGIGQATGMLFQNTADPAGYSDLENWPLADAAGGQARGYTCQEGDVLEVSAYLSAHRCVGELRIRFYNDANLSVGFSEVLGTITDVAGSSTNPDLWNRYGGRVAAPAGAAYATIHFRKYGTLSGGSSYLFIHKPQLCDSHISASVLAPYSPPGTTLINGGQIISETITATQLVKTEALISNSAQIGNGVITTAKIGTAQVDTLQVAGQAITAPAIAYTDWGGTVFGGSAAQYVIGMAIDSVGLATYINFTCSLDTPNTPAVANFYLYRATGGGGLVLLSAFAQQLGARNSPGYVFTDNPAPGNTVYYVTILVTAAGRQARLYQTGLYAIQFKR